jgi:hypothetical protein
MNAENFTEWLRRQGHHVIRTESSFWFNQGPRVYQAFPYHWIIHPSEEELKILLRSHRALALRYSTSIPAALGRLSYHIVYQQPSYGMENLGHRTRKNVRRGLRNCSVEPIGFDRLASEGWVLVKDTLERQNRSSSLSAFAWRHLCNAASDLPGFEAWGALVSGRLAAGALTVKIDDCYCFLHQYSSTKDLPLLVNNALTFAITQANIGHQGIRSVFYCLHSLDGTSATDQFKLHMGYVAKPVRQRVVFHPWCSPFVNRPTVTVLRAVLALRPSSGIIRKGEGMVRFFVDGKRPLEQQELPIALAEAAQHDA